MSGNWRTSPALGIFLSVLTYVRDGAPYAVSNGVMIQIRSMQILLFKLLLFYSGSSRRRWVRLAEEIIPKNEGAV